MCSFIFVFPSGSVKLVTKFVNNQSINQSNLCLLNVALLYKSFTSMQTSSRYRSEIKGFVY